MYKLFLILYISLVSCVGPLNKSEIKVKLKDKKTSTPTISSVQLTGDQLIVNGQNFQDLNTVKLNSNNLSVISNTGSKLILSASSAVTLAMGSALNLVVDTAYGAAAIPVIFNIVDGSVTASKLSDMGASTGQFLKYNGSTWVPTAISSGLTYMGSYNASSNSPDVTGGGFNGGEYYIVSTSGTRDLTYGSGPITWNVGDWLVWNSTNSDFDKINNTVGVTSVNGSSGVITNTQIFSGSVLNDIGDVDTAGIATGKILKWDGSKWAISDDLASGGASSVSTTEIVDGTIVDADVSGSAAIAQSKIAGLTTLATAVGSNTTALTSKVNTTTTVNGKALSSNVTLVTTDVAEGTNLYYTAARAKADAILNSTAGTETDQAASVAAMKTYVTTSVSTSVTGKADKTTTVNGQTLSSNVVLDTDDIAEGSTSFYHTTGRARTAAVVNSTSGSETDQAASVAAMKSYVTTQTSGAGTGDLKSDGSVSMSGSFNLGTQKIINGSGASFKGDASVPLTGTVQVSGTNFIGTGTSFTTQIVVGDLVEVNGEVFKITAITNNTSATVSIGATIGAGQTYKKLQNILAIKKNDDSDILKLTSNGQLFLGVTTNPTGKLTVENGDIVLKTDDGSSDAIKMYADNTRGTIDLYSGTSIYTKLTGNTGGTSYFKGSNLGIGVTSTTSKLHVDPSNDQIGIQVSDNDSTPSTKVVLIERNNSASAPAVSNAALSIIDNSSNIPFFIEDESNNPLFFINGSGSVGISNSSPSEKLEVSGNIKATGFIGDGSGLTNISNAITGNVNLNGDTSKLISVSRHTTSDTAGNNLSINAGGATSGATNKSGGDLVLSSGTATGTGSSKIEFKTSPASSAGATDNTPVTAMTILGDGNVGIRTPAPVATLHVVGKGSNEETLLVDSGNSSKGLHIKGTGNYLGGRGDVGILLENTGTGGNSWRVNSTNNNFTYGGSRLNIQNNDGTSPQLSVQYSKIGVMTPNPLSTLDVNGSIAIGSYAATNAAPVNGMIVSGNVGIGTTGPTEKLEVNGNVKADAYLYTSDLRFKKEIKTLSHSKKELLNVRGVEYIWRQDEFLEKNFEESLQYGFIAQEIELIFPHLVHTDKDGFKSVKYSSFIPLLVEAVKEQDLEVKKLHIKIEENNRSISSLKEENNRLSQNMKSLSERVEALERLMDNHLSK